METSKLLNYLSQKTDFLINISLAFIVKLTIVLFIIFAFLILALFIKKCILRIPQKTKSKKYILKLIADFTKVAIIILGVITALATIGLNMTAIIASLGLTGFAFGFAFQDSLSNLLAGLMILFYQPYTVGNNIEIENHKGEVTEINLRYTILKSGDNKVLIPNSKMLNVSLVLKETQNE